MIWQCMYSIVCCDQVEMALYLHAGDSGSGHALTTFVFVVEF